MWNIAIQLTVGCSAYKLIYVVWVLTARENNNCETGLLKGWRRWWQVHQCWDFPISVICLFWTWTPRILRWHPLWFSFRLARNDLFPMQARPWIQSNINIAPPTRNSWQWGYLHNTMSITCSRDLLSSGQTMPVWPGWCDLRKLVGSYAIGWSIPPGFHMPFNILVEKNIPMLMVYHGYYMRSHVTTMSLGRRCSLFLVEDADIAQRWIGSSMRRKWMMYCYRWVMMNFWQLEWLTEAGMHLPWCGNH